MTRRVISLFVLTLLVVAVTALTASASNDAKVSLLRQKGLDQTRSLNSENSTVDSRFSPTTSLGAYTADGGSPGYIIGRSMRDDQAHLNPGRFVDWRLNPQIHFIFAGQALAGHDAAGIARWIEYTMFDPTTAPNGVFLSSVMIQSNPLATGGWYPNIAIDETGHAIPTGEEFDPADPNRTSGMWWDLAGAGAWGTFFADILPQAMSINPDEYMMYPRIAYQEYSGQYIAHMLVLEDSGDPTCDLDAITYWRQQVAAAGPTGTWTTMLVTDDVWSNHFDIAAARGGSGNVGICWIQWPDYCNGNGGLLGVAHFMESTDGGVTWGAPVDLNDTTWEYQPWVDINGTYDTDGYFHLVWNGGPSGTIDPHRIFHWSNRTPGPDGGGTTSLIHIADGYQHMCGRAQSNVGNTGKPVISQCNDKLYVTWTQFGNWRVGDTLDCADENFPNAYTPQYNGEIYLSVSSTLNGLLWDAARNMTNSHTPGCDGTDENNCDHDAYGTMARYGMNTASFGTTYWNAVPEVFGVRDVLDPSFADDGWYLDYQFVNDLMPEPARYMDDQEAAIWTYNPIKWFRLPCVDPVIEPRINISQADFEHPVYWVKTGDIDVIDLEIENLGNAELNVTNIYANVLQGTGWLSILNTSTDIPPASSDIVQFQIDGSGYAAGTTTAIEAEIVIESNDLNAGDYIYTINTVVADTVMDVAWDTVTTGLPMTLTVANNGNAGNVGIGGANMGFENAGDCDAAADVYLYDLTPVVMLAVDNYSWNPFWQTTSTLPENFQPVGDGEETSHSSTADFDQYCSGTFVNADSSLGFTKYWVAPSTSSQFIIERWDVYSYDGGSYTGVNLGEFIDWDVPTYQASDNEGGFVVNPTGTDYLWQRGLLDPAPDEPPCTPEDARYCATGMLGYYTETEIAADGAVNHSDLQGGRILLDQDLFDVSGSNFDPDTAWMLLTTPGFEANNDESADQQTWMSYGAFDIPAGEVLHIWTVHATVYNGDETDVQTLIDEAEAWYLAHRGEVGATGCCGKFTDPAGYTGNTNCSEDGKITLSDITALIDHVYISKEPLCCQEAGNTNGSVDGKVTLSDITRLIDRVYISKGLTEPCM